MVDVCSCHFDTFFPFFRQTEHFVESFLFWRMSIERLVVKLNFLILLLRVTFTYINIEVYAYNGKYTILV